MKTSKKQERIWKERKHKEYHNETITNTRNTQTQDYDNIINILKDSNHPFNVETASYFSFPTKIPNFKAAASREAFSD